MHKMHETIFSYWKTCSAGLYLWKKENKWGEPQFTQAFCPQSLSRRCPRKTDRKKNSVLLVQMKFAGQIIRRRRHAGKGCQKSAQRHSGALVQYITSRGEILQVLAEINYQGISKLNGYSRDHTRLGDEAITIQNGEILLNTSAISWYPQNVHTLRARLL